jgi:hypothetical protein
MSTKKLPKVLEDLGFKLHAIWPGMFQTLENFNGRIDPRTRLEVCQVTDPEQLVRWLIPYKESYQCSESLFLSLFDGFKKMGLEKDLPWKVFLGTVDGEPAAISRLFCKNGMTGI